MSRNRTDDVFSEVAFTKHHILWKRGGEKKFNDDARSKKKKKTYLKIVITRYEKSGEGERREREREKKITV